MIMHTSKLFIAFNQPPAFYAGTISYSRLRLSIMANNRSMIAWPALKKLMYLL